ncbi:LysR family transcriptional regulator [Agrobacterium sp. SHOUNA12C]|uniref:LysR family transcriptional regulator n=1 Tax=Rhizobium rhizogenes TaxID=359 RepID=UPI00115DFA31|nr:LysR family transcriptional regulator [Rhizobium rhizogenes]MCJ9723674.1 LysR family transcriptional regulator [Agrobacterium sp. BETTINA12B]MCJ9759113.1 LysR family transcriptional regulator [Agrobacterium sp. SHOUNA12C]NTF53787.1 LysR family transcriptional regulator [Rhizobium rhizogenes]NTF60363.1 LysR family transcriptional regulator [Rhizobium rhizogenes]NTF73368.1 LysR family transcriptional regulator [Rhizobium rhizogenes]
MYLGALFIADTVFSIGSVRETARRLSLSASTVSGALRRLETDLAIKLVERASGELATLLASAKVKKGLQPIVAGMRALSALTKEPPTPEDYAQWAARLPLKIATIERFLEVADQGSINRAARRLRLGQPQLSLQIANLEDLFGCRLFERQAQGSMLTEAGREVQAILAGIAEAWDEMKATSDERFQRVARAVRIGSIIPTGSESWVARSLASLVARWNSSGNRNMLSLMLMTADDLREALRSGRIDVAIVDSVFGLDAFDHMELLATDMVAIAPPGSTERTVAALVDNHPLCVPSPRTGIGNAAMAFGYDSGDRRRFRGRDITSADSLPVIVDLVANHGYVSFLGRVSAMPIADKVRIVDPDEVLPLSYYLAHNGRKASIDACRLIRQAVRELVAE